MFFFSCQSQLGATSSSANNSAERTGSAPFGSGRDTVLVCEAVSKPGGMKYTVMSHGRIMCVLLIAVPSVRKYVLQACPYNTSQSISAVRKERKRERENTPQISSLLDQH